MLQAGFGNLGAGEHACHLVGAGAVIENADLGLGATVVFALLDYEMLAGKGGDLGQVRYAEDLLTTGERLEFLTDGFGGAAPNADIDFIKDEGTRSGVVFLRIWAVLPPTATFRASMTRDISPPEAISCNGLRVLPGWSRCGIRLYPSRGRSTPSPVRKRRPQSESVPSLRGH